MEYYGTDLMELGLCSSNKKHTKKAVSFSSILHNFKRATLERYSTMLLEKNLQGRIPHKKSFDNESTCTLYFMV